MRDMHLFRGERSICEPYPVVIYSRNPREHARHLAMVFERLKQYGPKLNGKKCNFALHETSLVGYVISASGIRSNPEKTRAIASMCPPQCVREVRAFLGMAGYYRTAVPDFASVARPLTVLTKKSSRWQWGTEQETAFRELQRLLLSDKVLA